MFISYRVTFIIQLRTRGVKKKKTPQMSNVDTSHLFVFHNFPYVSSPRSLFSKKPKPQKLKLKHSFPNARRE